MINEHQMLIVKRLARTRNAVEVAAYVVERIHGPAALAALATFLRALPSDASIIWGDDDWTAAAALAEQIDGQAAEAEAW